MGEIRSAQNGDLSPLCAVSYRSISYMLQRYRRERALTRIPQFAIIKQYAEKALSANWDNGSMNKRDALRLKAGDTLVFGHSQRTAECARESSFRNGTVLFVTPKGGIRIRNDRGVEEWVPYHHVYSAEHGTDAERFLFARLKDGAQAKQTIASDAEKLGLLLDDALESLGVIERGASWLLPQRDPRTFTHGSGTMRATNS